MNDGLHNVETEAIHGIDFLEPIYNVKDWSFALLRDVAITELVSSSLENVARQSAGGAYRARTDDLKLAKLALSQLS